MAKADSFRGTNTRGPKPGNAFKLARKVFFNGVDIDVIAERKKGSFIKGGLAKMHAPAQPYNGKTEHPFNFLQAMTAATASFAHGRNNVSSRYHLLDLALG